MSFEVKEKSGIMVYDSVQEATNQKTNFIYVKKDVATIQSLPFSKLYGVICDHGDHTLKNSGIPSELVLRTDLNLNPPKALFNDESPIAYFSPKGYGSAENTLTVIKLFNNLSSFNLIIYTTHEIANHVRPFSNDNINFFCYKNANELTITAKIIITYGYASRSFIEQKIPIIIIGPCGLGGWVIPDNIEYLLKENFIGRPGGRLNEPVPLEILVDEFLEIKEANDINEVLNKNLELLSNYLSGYGNLNIEDCVRHFKSIYSHLHDSTLRKSLHTKLASNVSIIKNENSNFIQREIISDLLFSLPESDIELLTDLRNGITCEELRKKNELSTQEFWDILMPLWERKAIVFYHEIP